MSGIGFVYGKKKVSGCPQSDLSVGRNQGELLADIARQFIGQRVGSNRGSSSQFDEKLVPSHLSMLRLSSSMRVTMPASSTDFFGPRS